LGGGNRVAGSFGENRVADSSGNFVGEKLSHRTVGGHKRMSSLASWEANLLTDDERETSGLRARTANCCFRNERNFAESEGANSVCSIYIAVATAVAAVAWGCGS